MPVMCTVPSGRSEDRTRTPAFAGHPLSKRCPTPTLGWSYLVGPLPDSNRPPTAYKAVALPDELKGRDVRCRCVLRSGAVPRLTSGTSRAIRRQRTFPDLRHGSRNARARHMAGEPDPSSSPATGRVLHRRHRPLGPRRGSPLFPHGGIHRRAALVHGGSFLSPTTANGSSRSRSRRRTRRSGCSRRRTA